MTGDVARLTDRTVIEVSGAEARPFLQRLVTNDVETLVEGQARYAALLTPQGKIITDFFVVASGESLLIDAPAATAADLARRLTLYRLRAKVTVADRSADLEIVAVAGDESPPDAIVSFADPRAPGLWRRAVVPRMGGAGAGDEAARDAYRNARVRAGIPQGGVDFAFGEVFPHDANLDRLGGVDFRKGCYVGQEVVSRVQHRGTARKRVVAFDFEGAPPRAGSDILSGEMAIGTMGSAVAGRGLGLVRIDRLAEAIEAGGGITADGVALRQHGPA